MAFNKKLNTRLNKSAKKLFIINMLGGKCEHCGETRFYVMNFHHDSDELEKSFNVASGCGYRLSDIIEEAKKCILLCANCHQKHHMKTSNEYEIRTNTKRTLFEYIGTSSCNCGESDSRILVFHHKRDKKFEISDWITNKHITDVNKLPQKIKDELDKCVVLCHNCHLEEHLDKEFYDHYYDEILDISKRIKEISKPLDKELVREMFLGGMKQIDIAKHFDCVKSTICGILKEFGLTSNLGEKRHDRDMVLKLHSEGKFNKEIMTLLNLSRTTLFQIYKDFGIQSNINKIRTRRFDISEEELYSLLETKNYREIGEIYDVSNSAVYKRKKKFDKDKIG
jgi:transposase